MIRGDFNRPCGQCGKPVGRRSARAMFCLPCANERSTKSVALSHRRHPQSAESRAAHKAVAQAIGKGFLQRPSLFACLDCGGRAQCYDHRDYNKPLDVQPVCYSCNVKRGKAIPYVEDAARSAN